MGDVVHRRPVHACLSAALSAVAATGCEPRERAPQDSADVVATVSAVPSAAATLRIVSYNVNYGVEGDASTLEAIRAIDADLVFLQETTDGWARAIGASLADVYPHRAFAPPTTYVAGGLGVLSKTPFEGKQVMPSPVGWFDAWRLVAETPIGKLQLLDVHLRPPLTDPDAFLNGYFSTQRDRVEEITSYVPSLEPGLPTIVAGDFNEAEDGDAVHVLEKRGLHSVLPDFAPDQRTWHWFTEVGEVEARLDHVVVSHELEPVSARVHEVGKSDHFPVEVVLRRR